jgi:hypothetical protein
MEQTPFSDVLTALSTLPSLEGLGRQAEKTCKQLTPPHNRV